MNYIILLLLLSCCGNCGGRDYRYSGERCERMGSKDSGECCERMGCKDSGECCEKMGCKDSGECCEKVGCKDSGECCEKVGCSRGCEKIPAELDCKYRDRAGDCGCPEEGIAGTSCKASDAGGQKNTAHIPPAWRDYPSVGERCEEKKEECDCR